MRRALGLPVWFCGALVLSACAREPSPKLTAARDAMAAQWAPFAEYTACSCRIDRGVESIGECLCQKRGNPACTRSQSMAAVLEEAHKAKTPDFPGVTQKFLEAARAEPEVMAWSLEEVDKHVPAPHFVAVKLLTDFLRETWPQSKAVLERGAKSACQAKATMYKNLLKEVNKPK